MPASTLLDNLQAQFRSENISGTIQISRWILPQIALEAQRIYSIDIRCSAQWDSEHGNDPGYVLFNSLDTTRKSSYSGTPENT